MAEPGPGPRPRFAAVVLLGLACAGLAALAGTKVWARARPRPDTRAADWQIFLPSSGGQVPLATALALVVLAGWGVLLVTRGRTRRLAGWVSLLASGALLVTTGWGRWSVTGSLERQWQEAGLDLAGVDLTGWYWIALLAAAGCVATTSLAVRSAARWPEMGSRYDAPVAGQVASVGQQDASNLDLWKAMDEGRDPTSGD